MRAFATCVNLGTKSNEFSTPSPVYFARDPAERPGMILPAFPESGRGVPSRACLDASLDLHPLGKRIGKDQNCRFGSAEVVLHGVGERGGEQVVRRVEESPALPGRNVEAAE